MNLSHSRPLVESHPGQMILWNDPARFSVSVMGRRWGKTTTAQELLTALSSLESKNFWYVAPTYDQARELLWDNLKERWSALRWKFKANDSRLRMERLKTGTIIALKSGELGEGKMRGRGLDGVIFDECADIKKFKDIWTKAVRPALSDRNGWAKFFGTPKGMNNYFYDLFQEAKIKEGWSAHQMPSWMAPWFQTEAGIAEIESARRDLDEKTFNQEYGASFESFTGRICHEFDRGKHHTDYTYDDTLPIYIGQDFNRNPMAGALAQMVAGRQVYFTEMVIPTSSTDEVCQIIKGKFPKWEQHGVIVRPDATGARRTSNSSASDHDIIRRHGFKVETKYTNPRRVDRWAACNKAFKNDQCLINTRNCPKLTKELESIVYKDGTCEPDIKDALVGHIFDAFGYNIHFDFPPIEQAKITVSRY